MGVVTHADNPNAWESRGVGEWVAKVTLQEPFSNGTTHLYSKNSTTTTNTKKQERANRDMKLKCYEWKVRIAILAPLRLIASYIV